MITLPTQLANFMKGKDLAGLKPFALLYRNKWDSVNNKFALEDTPIDISALIAKPNTLSMTLDVNEVAQYNANNVTLTLEDTKNYFVEGTTNSYFPDGYQVYGSRVILYYGLDSTNRTPLFTGVIKELPAHKPDKYQVDLKLVSPLEMLKDIEAKDFSDKVTGETLTYKSTDSDGHRIYWTSGTGVGGFEGVYADGVKLFEGIDFETDQLNLYGNHAVVTIINSAYYSANITADYYTWKTGLTVEQIVSGLVALGGYTSANEDIRDVIWQTSVRTSVAPTALFTLGYTPNNSNGFNFTGGGNSLWGSNLAPNTWLHAQSIYPENFIYELTIGVASYNRTYVFLGEMRPNPDWYNQPTLYNGFSFTSDYASSIDCVFTQNGVGTNFTLWASNSNKIYIKKTGNVYEFYTDQQYSPEVQYTATANFDLNFGGQNLHAYNRDQKYYLPALLSQKLTDTDTGIVLDKCGIAYQVTQGVETSWVSIEAEKSNDDAPTSIKYRTSDNGTDFTAWNATDLGSDLGVSSKIIQFVLTSTNAGNAADFSNVVVYYLGSTLTLQLVNLSGRTVLEALQDFALISGYEFGVDRQGVFFFRPRLSSTLPVYVLDHSELVKVDSVKKNLSDFFTKLTLTFAQVPIEFYANTGARPTPIDKYGVINKEIDKPDIVNYDNPELAQAIGPQLLEVYSALPNVIQATGKLNLALELADIVSLRRNYNLIADPEGTEFEKYINQQTYYRACKITGLNYNFSKKQITYTLRDVTDSYPNPQPGDLYEFVYDLPIRLGVK